MTFFLLLLFCVCWFFLLQIYFYTFEVLQAAGFEERMVYYMTLSIGLAELLATVVCVSQVMLLWECITVCFSGTDTNCDFCPSELHH